MPTLGTRNNTELYQQLEFHMLHFDGPYTNNILSSQSNKKHQETSVTCTFTGGPCLPYLKRSDPCNKSEASSSYFQWHQESQFFTT